MICESQIWCTSLYVQIVILTKIPSEKSRIKKFKLQLVMAWVRYFKWIFRKVKIAWKHQLKFFAIHHFLTSIVPKWKCVHAAIVFCLLILFEIWEFDDWIPNLFTLLSNNLNITTDLKKNLLLKESVKLLLNLSKVIKLHLRNNVWEWGQIENIHWN